ncbi:MAG: TetR/AcrR family transcriptional regulator [Sphingomonadales bacterium]|nr:TetR/AcrR family transcriptional regulator [Sphingomonadales bacterium]
MSSKPESSDAAARRRGRPTRDQAERLDDELLSHALDHFLEKGFEGTTLNAITASLGMSKQTVYLRFGDKLTLFRAALRRAIDQWLVPLEHLRALETDDLEQTLLDVSRTIVTTLMSPAGLRLIRITNAESFRMPEIGDYTYRRGHAQIARYLTDLLRRRIFAGDPAPPDLDDLATAYLNLLSGPARRDAWGLDEKPIDIDSFVRSRVKLFLHGVLPAR